MGLDRSTIEELQSKLEWMEEDLREGLYMSEDDIEYMLYLKGLLKEEE